MISFFTIFLYVSTACFGQSFSLNIFAVEVSLSSDIYSVAAQSGCTVKERLHLPGNIYILHCSSSLSVNSRLRSRQVLQYEQQEPLRLVKKQQVVFLDPHHDKQWYLHNPSSAGCDMQVHEAWRQGLTGAGVVVAVVDDGVNFNHVDLRESHNKNASVYPFAESGSYFPSSGDSHGTNCAGVIVSKPNNSFCGVGVAFGSTLGSIRLLTTTETDADVARALSHENQLVHIYTNSWGPEDSGSMLAGPNWLTEKAIEEGVSKGRNGLGSIFMFAAGNGYEAGDNCGFDGYTNSPYVLSISGLSQTCGFPRYSEGCTGLFAVAFTQGSTSADSQGILTTAGASDTSCIYFSGTSASTPMAAGAVALMLEANGELTWRDVQHIVAVTSRQDVCPKATPAPTTNNRGLRMSYYCGFGAMSVSRMVSMAKIWTTVPTLLKCSLSVTGSPLATLETTKQLQIKLKSNACLSNIKFLESVLVKLTATLARRGGLTVYLTSPQNTTSEVISGRKSDDLSGDSQLHKWPQKSIFYWGENPNGNWTFLFKSTGSTTNFGQIQGIELLFFGTAEEPMRLKKPDVVPEWLKAFDSFFQVSTTPEPSSAEATTASSEKQLVTERNSGTSVGDGATSAMSSTFPASTASSEKQLVTERNSGTSVGDRETSAKSATFPASTASSERQLVTERNSGTSVGTTATNATSVSMTTPDKVSSSRVSATLIPIIGSGGSFLSSTIWMYFFCIANALFLCNSF